jgi:hypothetical protein
LTSSTKTAAALACAFGGPQKKNLEDEWGQLPARYLASHCKGLPRLDLTIGFDYLAAKVAAYLNTTSDCSFAERSQIHLQNQLLI